jgi:hypothetical protein
MLRQSSLFQFKQGDHACVFYRSEKSLMEVLTPYVADGLRKGERCFGAQKPSTIKQLYYDLRFLGIDVEKEIKRGALEFHIEEEVYFRQGRFEPGIMMDMLVQSIDKAVQLGFTGFRTAGELSWASKGKAECDMVIGYEHLVQKTYPGRAAIGICQYAIDEFPSEVLDSVLEAHRLHLVDREGESNHRSIEVGYGHCSAEIVADKLVMNPNYYFVVQQRQPREILGWGRAQNFDKATAQVDKIAARSVSTN